MITPGAEPADTAGAPPADCGIDGAAGGYGRLSRKCGAGDRFAPPACVSRNAPTTPWKTFRGKPLRVFLSPLENRSRGNRKDCWSAETGFPQSHSLDDDGVNCQFGA